MSKCLVWSLSLASTDEQGKITESKRRVARKTKSEGETGSNQVDKRARNREREKKRGNQMQYVRIRSCCYIYTKIYMNYPRARLFSTRRKESLLFSRVIHARFFANAKEKENKQTVSHVYGNWIDTKKNREQKTSSNSVKIEKKSKWHTHAHLNG